MKYPKTISKINQMRKRPHGIFAWDGWEKEIESAIDKDVKEHKVQKALNT